MGADPPLKRRGPGLYETPDGRYSIERGEGYTIDEQTGADVPVDVWVLIDNLTDEQLWDGERMKGARRALRENLDRGGNKNLGP